MQVVTNDGFRWDLQPEFAPLLARVLAAPGGVVKQGPAKLVTRHELDGRCFYVKRYRHAEIAGRPWKFRLRRTQARREWDLAARLSARGLPIVEHLAHGELRSWRGVEESILITAGFPGRELDPSLDLPVDALVALVEQMAAAGVHHTDLHLGNLLFRRNPDEVRLVDLDGVEVKSAITPGERDEMLAWLAMSLPVPVSPAVRALARQRRRELLARRARRSLGANREFGRHRLGNLNWQVRRDEWSESTRALLGLPGAGVEAARIQLKRGGASTLVRLEELVIKRFNPRDPWRWFKGLFRRSRAADAFLKAYHLELTGLATARGVAFAQESRWGLPWRSYLATHYVHGTPIHLWPGDLRSLLPQLADLVARLHEEGFRHRDLKETNLLVDDTGRIHLIDLDGLSYLGEVPLRRAAFDLRRLARGVGRLPGITQADRVRFLLRYCRARRLRPRDLPGSLPARLRR